MVYDCFSFFNELDLLEIRFNVLKDVVDRFVLVEAPWTHAGAPKKLFYAENAVRFAAFKDRVVHIVAQNPPPAPVDASIRQQAWLRENFQRNELARGLRSAQPDDTILLSDLDEIPDPCVIRRLVGRPGIARLGMMMCMYFLNVRSYTVGNWLLGTRVCSFGAFKSMPTGGAVLADDCFVPQVNEGPTMTRLRLLPDTYVCYNAGWHFSYCGGIERIRDKIKAIAHVEYATESILSSENITKAMADGHDLFGRPQMCYAVPVDGRFPTYLRENASRYAHLIAPVDAALLRRTRVSRFRAHAYAIVLERIKRLVPRALMPLATRLYLAVCS